MRLVLNVATPTLVLKSAESLYEGLDFVYGEGYVYFFDVEKLAGRFESFEELQRAVAGDPRRYAEKWLSSVEIPRGAELKVSGPIPPSSVKGMLRTAYLYKRLKEDGQLLERFIKAVEEGLEGDPRFVSRAAESLVFRLPIGRFGYDVFNSVSVYLVDGRWEFSGYEITVETRGGVSAKFYAVAIRPGSRGEYEVVVRSPRDPEGRPISPITEGEIVEALKTYSNDLSSFERGRGLYVPGCPAVRIGLGAGRRWKTVLNLLLGHPAGSKLYDKIYEVMSRRLKRAWGDLSVKFASDGRNKWPVGWACYEFK